VTNTKNGDVMRTITMTVKNAEGDETTYTLMGSMNAAIALQQRTKMTIGALLDAAAGLDFIAIRGVAWWLLQKFHADEFKVEADVNAFIDRAGGPQVFFEALEKLAVIGRPAPVPTLTVAEGSQAA
jgi:hypothetical protein